MRWLAFAVESAWCATDRSRDVFFMWLAIFPVCFLSARSSVWCSLSSQDRLPDHGVVDDSRPADVFFPHRPLGFVQACDVSLSSRVRPGCFSKAAPSAASVFQAVVSRKNGLRPCFSLHGPGDRVPVPCCGVILLRSQQSCLFCALPSRVHGQHLLPVVVEVLARGCRPSDQRISPTMDLNGAVCPTLASSGFLVVANWNARCSSCLTTVLRATPSRVWQGCR